MIVRLAGLAAIALILALPVLSRAAVPDAVTPDGGRYYGPLVDGKLHGRGRIEWENGTRYEGELAGGQMSGRGRIKFGNGNLYDGEFRGGMYHGKGRHEGLQGEVYDGDFDRNDFSGTGVYTTKDGIRYEGGFRKWRFHGPGRYVDSSGTAYEGSFIDGELAKGKVVSKAQGTYEGEFKQWRPHGQGVLRLPNGDVYKGGFAQGLHEGEGTLTHAKPRPDGRTEESGVWRFGTLLGNEAGRSRARIDIEGALYAQRALLDKALASLEPRRAGRINLYLLAVAGDGSQEVFRREVEFVEDQFARKFGTKGHAVTLVNSRSTLETLPMATLTSIREALKAIAARMNQDQDILFLFLTSHGSREHELSLAQNSIELRGLRAAELGGLLKESAIRWKVVVISACYSGGFIDPIKDDSTLVITAARHDRQSFGCADENDFTYFGRAFFKEALPQSRSFQEAFRRAEALVGDWERKDAKEAAAPAKDSARAVEEARSLPQMSNPGPVGQHLQRWWAQNPK